MPFIKPRDSRHCKDQSVSDCEHVDEYYSGFCSSTVILEILNGHIKSILAAKKTNDTDGGSVRCMVLFRLLFRCRRAFSPLERPFDRRNVARRSLSHIVSVLQVIRTFFIWYLPIWPCDPSSVPPLVPTLPSSVPLAALRCHAPRRRISLTAR